MRPLLLALLALAACTFDSNSFTLSDAALSTYDAPLEPKTDAAFDATIADASADADPNAPDAAPCVGSELPVVPLNMQSCDVPAPLAVTALDEAGDYLLDTSTGLLLTPSGSEFPPHAIVPQANGLELFVLSYQSFTLASNSRLQVKGSRALAVVSFGGLTINGELSAAGQGSAPGASGDQDAICLAFGRGVGGTVQLSNDNPVRTAGAGGGGGAFANPGGNGAGVDTVSGIPSNPIISGGNAALDLDLEPLRGGCAAGSGGNGGGIGGAAGGAIELYAAGVMTINGTVTASGGGGAAPSVEHAGGGGGGSGGGLLLQGGSISIAGAVTANGGAGAEGTRGGDSADSGEDGSWATDTAAEGGGGQSSGGNGGNGGAKATFAGNGTEGSSSPPSAAGGGGGGGSVGRIRLIATGGVVQLSGSVVSPSPN
jgi:hypothetical protein